MVNPSSLVSAYLTPRLITNTDARYVLLMGLTKLVIMENEVWEVASRVANNTSEPFMYLKVQEFSLSVVLS